MSQPEIENLLSENRRFPPSAEFQASAIAQPGLYDEAKDSVAFWAKQAKNL